MTPRLAREPITGCTLIATRPAHVLLTWLPVACVLAAFGLGWWVGRYF